jgi:hypothetical protein
MSEDSDERAGSAVSNTRCPAGRMPLRVRLLIRLYHVTRKLLRRSQILIRAAFDGAWLGIFDDHATRVLDETYYDDERKYADEAYNRRGLEYWEKEAIERFFADHPRIVVTGAGGGREVLALLERGYDATGYEPNRRLVRFGASLLAESGHPGRLWAVERDAWPPEALECDGVIVGWGSYMLIRGRDRRVAFLRQARACVEVGSPLLVSFFARAGEPRYLRLVASIGSAIRRLRGLGPVELGDTLDPNYVHYFDRGEIESELREGGFHLAWYDARDYGKAVGIASEDGEHSAAPVARAASVRAHGPHPPH